MTLKSSPARYIALLVVLLVLSTAVVSAQLAPLEAWIARYDAPDSFQDIGRAMALDALGNVYVVGSLYTEASNAAYVTVKYDAAGNELWAVRYDNSDVGVESPNDVVVDAAGNAYVTGSSANANGVIDIATVKYDPAGNELWVARHDGPAHKRDYGFAIGLDDAGNAYVAGESEGAGVGAFLAVVKYDAAGNEQWARYWSGRINYGANTSAMAVDDAGNVYVTGRVIDILEGRYAQLYATVKYDTAGNLLWNAVYAGPASGGWARDIAIDDSGNAYVTGYNRGATGTDIATIKYSSDGNELWVARYGTGNGLESAVGNRIAVDGAGNVYVAGLGFVTLTDPDVALLKYDASGNLLWEARHESPGEAYGTPNNLVIDSLGSVYVAGTRRPELDYQTLKYSGTGAFVWQATYNGPGDGYENLSDMAVDSVGNIYVTGWSEDVTYRDYDITTIKYAQDPKTAARALIAAIEVLIDDGALGSVDGARLIQKLETAIFLLTDPVDKNDIAAFNELLVLITQAEVMIANDSSLEEILRPLIVQAEWIADRILQGA